MTPVVCCTSAGIIVTTTSRIVLTVIDTSAPAVAKPVASTVTCQNPGVRSSRLNSPRESKLTRRTWAVPMKCASTVAATILALEASCTSPRRLPLVSWPHDATVQDRNSSVSRIQVRRMHPLVYQWDSLDFGAWSIAAPGVPLFPQSLDPRRSQAARIRSQHTSSSSSSSQHGYPCEQRSVCSFCQPRLRQSSQHFSQPHSFRPCRHLVTRLSQEAEYGSSTFSRQIQTSRQKSRQTIGQAATLQIRLRHQALTRTGAQSSEA
jgi:hypothetical protein